MITGYTSGTLLRMVNFVEDTLQLGRYPVWVTSPPPGGGTSDTLWLDITRFAPVIPSAVSRNP